MSQKPETCPRMLGEGWVIQNGPKGTYRGVHKWRHKGRQGVGRGSLDFSPRALESSHLMVVPSDDSQRTG